MWVPAWCARRRTSRSGSAYGSALATGVAAEASAFGAVASSASPPWRCRRPRPLMRHGGLAVAARRAACGPAREIVPESPYAERDQGGGGSEEHRVLDGSVGDRTARGRSERAQPGTQLVRRESREAWLAAHEHTYGK